MTHIQRLRENTNKYHILLKGLKWTKTVLSADSHVQLRINKQQNKMLGARRDDVLNKRLHNLFRRDRALCTNYPNYHLRCTNKNATSEAFKINIYE